MNNLIDNGVGIDDDQTGVNIYLNRYNVIMSIFDNFGDLITRLAISFQDIPMEKGRQILKRINGLSASFEWFYLHGCSGNLLNGLKPFKNVKRFMFGSGSQNEPLEIRSKYNTLKKLFPKLLTFSVLDPKPADWTFIKGKISTLLNFEFDLSWDNPNNVNAFDAVDFLKSNPQIDTVSIMNTNIQSIKVANDNLPNLKILNLMWLSEKYLDHDCEPIHLKTVEELFVELRFEDRIPENIYFHDQLKALSLIVQLSSADKWTEFLTDQVPKNLAELDLKYDGLTYDQLMGITKQLKNLEMLGIVCKTKFEADQVVDFIKKSKALTHFKFELEMNESEQNHLEEKVSANWNVAFKKVNRAVEITFER